MITTPLIITTSPEQRQIARTLVFDPTLAPHINWDSVAQQARELGAHIEARWTQRGACTVLLFWAYQDKDGTS